MSLSFFLSSRPKTTESPKYFCYNIHILSFTFLKIFHLYLLYSPKLQTMKPQYFFHCHIFDSGLWFLHLEDVSVFSLVSSLSIPLSAQSLTKWNLILSSSPPPPNGCSSFLLWHNCQFCAYSAHLPSLYIKSVNYIYWMNNIEKKMN